jgi:uncharacterized membrane protein YsdA (DUF1294 family)
VNLQWLVVGIFVLLLAAATLAGRLHRYVAMFYLGFGVITFLAYWRDKRAARREARRIPEMELHLLALCGGWPGALVAQQLIRHKSSKLSFQVVFWITVAANIAVLSWLAWPGGMRALVPTLRSLG